MVPQKAIEKAIALTSPEAIHIEGDSIRFASRGMGITLDALAKGYIVDAAAAKLEEHGVERYLINAGGDIRAAGKKSAQQPWIVAIEDPEKKQDYPSIISLHNEALATSGIYERYYDKARVHHHLVSPYDGSSPSNHISVSVKAPTSMQADALATTLSLMPQDQGMALIDSLPHCACLIVTRDGTLAKSWRWDLVR